MNPKLFRKLREWRDATARKEGEELFRVLPNKAIEEIAVSEPRNKEELVSIKGIKEKKFQKYGRKILGIVNGGDEDREGGIFLSSFSRGLSVGYRHACTLRRDRD